VYTEGHTDGVYIIDVCDQINLHLNDKFPFCFWIYAALSKHRLQMSPSTKNMNALWTLVNGKAAQAFFFSKTRGVTYMSLTELNSDQIGTF